MAGGAGAFLVALAFLAGQVRDGRDAALGPAPVASPKPRVVVVRRVIRRVVVTQPARRSSASAPPPAATTSAPAPAAAPAAPAPAPAPLTTRSS
jgi:hypothetical protein